MNHRRQFLSGLFLVVTGLAAGIDLPGQGDVKVPEVPASSGAVIIVGGRVLTDPAKPPVPGDVLIRDGIIEQVGVDLKTPEGARIIDAAGKLVLPAFIDVGCAALFDEATLASGAAPADAASEMISFLDPRPRLKILASGVGAAYLDLPVRAGARGPTGAIALLDPESEGLPFVDALAGVTWSFGGRNRNESTLTLRRGAKSSVTSALDGAKRYRESWKKYEKDLAEYEPKRKEWEEKQKKPGDAAKPKEGEKEKPAEEGKTPPRTGARESMRERLQKAADARRAKAEGGEAKDDAAKSTTDSKPKPPEPPKKESLHEAVLRILDRKTPLRIEAQWKEDIVLACELAKARNLRLLLIGAAEALDALEAIKDSGATVVVPPAVAFHADTLDRGAERPDLAAALSKAGIPIAFMTAGAEGYRSDSLPLIAALAVSQGLPLAAALRALTSDAATALGQGSVLGGIEKGRTAAVQIIDGEPLAPASRVLATVIGKRVVDFRSSG